jgi:hypothetical protein
MANSAIFLSSTLHIPDLIQSSENMKHDDYKLKQSPHNDSARIHSPEHSGDQTPTKLEEIKSLCMSLIPHPFEEIMLIMIELDLKGRKDESLLDDYLQRLRLTKAFHAQLSPKGLEKPISKKLH